MKVYSIDNLKYASSSKNISGKSIYLRNNTLSRLKKYFTNDVSMDTMINKLLDVVTPNKSEFIWALDIEKYNEEKSRREN